MADGPSSCGSRGRYSANPVDFHTASYQYRPHTPSESRGPGGQASIGATKSHADVSAQGAKVGLRLEEEVARIDDRRRRSGRDQVVVQLDLLGKSDVVRGDIDPGAHVGGHHLAGFPDQHDVRETGDPGSVDAGEQVMGHVLLVDDVDPVGHRTEQRGRHLAPVGLAGTDHLVPAWMIQPGDVEVVGIQRLVDHHRVVAVLPRPHQRGGDVARARPHRQAHHGRSRHRQRRAALPTSRSTASR